MAVGSRYKGSDAAHNKAEVYLHSTSSWTTKANYTFSKIIYDFDIIAHTDLFILVGGLYPYQRADLSTGFSPGYVIAKFNPDANKWTKLGNLRTGRHGFAVIQNDQKYLVMGGEGYKSTEVCVWNSETIECSSREPSLNEFRYYPALMIVDSDYAGNC